MQKILVVDDEEDMRSLQKEMLEKHDYEVFVASSGKEAIELVREEKPDLVLLDVVMPEMRGWEVCRKIREDPDISKTKIIMVTSQSTYDDKVHSFGTKADWHIAKPFQTETYLETIEWALEREAAKMKLTSNLWHFSNKILKKKSKEEGPDAIHKESKKKAKKRLRLFKIKNIFKRKSHGEKEIEDNMVVETPKARKFGFLSVRGIIHRWIQFDLKMTRRYLEWDGNLTRRYREWDREFTHNAVTFFKRLAPGKNPLDMGHEDIKEVEKLGLEDTFQERYSPNYEMKDSFSKSFELLQVEGRHSPLSCPTSINDQLDIPEISENIPEKPKSKPKASIDQNYIRNLVFATLKPKGKQPYYLNGEPINNLLELKKNLTYIKDSDAYWVALWIEYLGDEITSKRILDSPAKFREIISDRCDYIMEYGRDIMDDMPEKLDNPHENIMYS